MKTAITISELLNRIQHRNGFTDQQLANHVGVSRWTVYRIRQGKIGETVSTSLVDAILREQSQTTIETSA